MNKIILIIFISITLNASFKSYEYTDYGIHGKQYEITEYDLYKKIIEAVKDYQKSFNKKEIEDIVKSEVSKKAIFNSDIEKCLKNFDSGWKDDYFVFKNDYRNPYGRIIFKKGEKKLAPSVPGEKNICFIEGSILPVAINQINYFKKIKPHCLFLVVNRDVRELYNKFPGESIYPASKVIIDRFGVKCIPNVLSFSGTKKRIEEYGIEQFKFGK